MTAMTTETRYQITLLRKQISNLVAKTSRVADEMCADTGDHSADLFQKIEELKSRIVDDLNTLGRMATVLINRDHHHDAAGDFDRHDVESVIADKRRGSIIRKSDVLDGEQMSHRRFSFMLDSRTNAEARAEAEQRYLYPDELPSVPKVRVIVPSDLTDFLVVESGELNWIIPSSPRTGDELTRRDKLLAAGPSTLRGFVAGMGVDEDQTMGRLVGSIIEEFTKEFVSLGSSEGEEARRSLQRRYRQKFAKIIAFANKCGVGSKAFSWKGS